MAHHSKFTGNPGGKRKPPPGFLTVGEAGGLAGYSRGGSYRAVKRGEMPAVRLGGMWIVPEDWLTRLVAEAEAGARERQRLAKEKGAAPDEAPPT